MQNEPAPVPNVPNEKAQDEVEQRQMNRRYTLVCLCALAMAACLIAWQNGRARSQSYEGKTLNQWLKTYDNGSVPEADIAVRHFGTNSIPYLLHLLDYRDRPWKRKIPVLLAKFSVPRRFGPDYDFSWHYRAGCAFSALGPLASNAVPALLAVFDRDLLACPSSATAAARGLAAIGPPSRPAISSLLNGLQSTNEMIRFCSVFGLGRIHEQPQIVVPALTNCLGDVSHPVRINAMAALGGFKSDAKEALPILLQLRTNSSDRIFIDSAILSIDADVYREIHKESSVRLIRPGKPEWPYPSGGPERQGRL